MSYSVLVRRVGFFGLTLLAAIMVACGSPGPSASGCTASTRTVHGVVGSYCTYAVVVNGFRCPPDRPFRSDIPRGNGQSVVICSNLENHPIPAEACTGVSCAQGTDAEVASCEASIDTLLQNRSCDNFSSCVTGNIKRICRSGVPTVVRQYAECFNTAPRPQCSFGGEDCILSVQAATWREDITAARNAVCTACQNDQAALGSDFCSTTPTRTTSSLTMFGPAQIELLRQCATQAASCGGARACLDWLYGLNTDSCSP